MRDGDTIVDLSDQAQGPFLAERKVDDSDVAFVVASLEPADRVLEPHEPSRSVCRLPNNKLVLTEIRQSRKGIGYDAFEIGPHVSFNDAGALAAEVLRGDELARTHPQTVHILAVAYIGAIAAAEKRRAAEPAPTDAGSPPARLEAAE